MDVDPLASMRCWAIGIELGGRTYDVPALSAVDWWPVFSSGDLSRILDFVVSSPEDPFNLDDLLLTGRVDAAELGEALKDTAETVAGRSFHVALVLATVANDQWLSINGALTRRGFRWEGQPLGAALDAVYAEVTSRLDDKALAEFLALLEDESKTDPTKKRQTPERVVGEFESMAGPRPTAGAVATGGPSDSARPKTRPRLQPPRPAAQSGVPKNRPGRRAGSGPAASS